MPTDTIVKIKPQVEIKEPPLYRVIYMNDDVTTMEFVIETLMIFFRLEHDQAMAITQKIHEEGSAVVAVLPFEIAEQKGIEVSMLAKRHNFPLVIKLEADE